MKTFLMTCLFAVSMMAQAQEKVEVLSAEDVEVVPGGKAELVINMDYETDETVVGWDCYLYLPKGIDLLYDEDEEDYVYVVSSALHKKALRNGFKITATTDGGYMLYCIDTGALTPMTKTKGELVRLTLVASDEAEENSKGLIKDIALTNEQNISLESGNIIDVEFNIHVKETTTSILDIEGSHSKALRYNTKGQLVDDSYRGVIIERGHKKIVKQ